MEAKCDAKVCYSDFFRISILANVLKWFIQNRLLKKLNFETLCFDIVFSWGRATSRLLFGVSAFAMTSAGHSAISWLPPKAAACQSHVSE